MKKLMLVILLSMVSCSVSADWAISKDQFERKQYRTYEAKPFIGSVFTIRKREPAFPKRITTRKCIKLRSGGFDCTKKEFGVIKRF